MDSSGPEYWCHVCHRSLRLSAGDPIVCPTCRGAFLEEVSGGQGVTNPFDGDLVATMVNWLNNRGNNEGRDQLPDGLLHGPFLILRRRPHGRNGLMELLLGNDAGIEPRPLPANIGDYFLGTGLDELIEQLSQNDRCGPPPAPRAAVDAMPRIKINPQHLTKSSHCPVCNEQFEVGGEAREMPCKHIYHSDCIVPWLTQHNSCPVCRQGLPSEVPETAEAGSSASGSNSASFPTGPPVPGGQGEAPVFSITMEPFGQNNNYRNPPVFIEGGRNSNASTRNSSIIRDHSTARQAPNSRNDNHRCNLISYLLRFWPSSANPPSNSQRDRNASHSNDNVNRRRVGRD